VRQRPHGLALSFVFAQKLADSIEGKERMVARDSGFRIDAAGAGGYLRDGSHLPSFLAALAGRGFEF